MHGGVEWGSVPLLRLVFRHFESQRAMAQTHRTTARGRLRDRYRSCFYWHRGGYFGDRYAGGWRRSRNLLRLECSPAFHALRSWGLWRKYRPHEIECGHVRRSCTNFILKAQKWKKGKKRIINQSIDRSINWQVCEKNPNTSKFLCHSLSSFSLSSAAWSSRCLRFLWEKKNEFYHWESEKRKKMKNRFLLFRGIFLFLRFPLSLQLERKMKGKNMIKLNAFVFLVMKVTPVLTSANSFMVNE